MSNLDSDSEHPVEQAKVVEATIIWQHTPVLVSGVLQNGVLPEGNNLLVELNPLQTKPPGWQENTLWVDVNCLNERSVVVRSELWALPEDEGREYSLRSLLFSLCNWVRTGCTRVYLAEDTAGAQRGLVELGFWISVPLANTLEYLQELRKARGGATMRPLAYKPPEHALYELACVDQMRPRIAQSAGHLAHWFSGNIIWSVFIWHEGCLYHGVQFSLAKKIEKAVVRSFGLHPTHDE